jgi:hypothetical protein
MGQIDLRFPLGLSRALTLSYDDGVEQDMKLIGILQKHGLKCTFNLNSGAYSPEGTVFKPGTIHRRMSKSMVTQTYKGSGMETAIHGLTHPSFVGMPPAMMAYEILTDKINLENQFGTIVKGAAYPYGSYDSEVINTLKSCGIGYCRTVCSTHNFYLPQNWLTLNPTCHHNDPELMDLLNRFISGDNGREAHMFYLWGHSYEFEENNNWELIEKFAEKAGGNKDIWYATNGEIYDYVQDFNRLVWSADGRQVFNPNYRDIWFSLDYKLYSIKPGEKMNID